MFDFSGLSTHPPNGMTVVKAANELVLRFDRGGDKYPRYFTVVHQEGSFHIFHRSKLSQVDLNNGRGELLKKTDDLGKMMLLLGYRVRPGSEWVKQHQKERTIL